jgi:hypothetical protein
VKWDQASGKVLIVDNTLTNDPITGRTTKYDPKQGVKIGNASADKNIGVEFGGIEEGKISVTNTGNSDVFINGDIRNGGGNVTIQNDQGGIYAYNTTSSIFAKDIDLKAPSGDIGTSAQAVRIDTNGGVLNGTAKGVISVEEVNGDLTIGKLTTQGNVKVIADGSILGKTNTDAVIFGNDLSLTSNNGGIGKEEQDLVIQAEGVLTASARKSIYLTQKEGLLKLNTVASLEGDVVLTAPGGFEDDNFNETFDPDTKEKLQAVWDKLGLQDQSKIEKSIEEYKAQKKTEYTKQHRISDGGTPYDPRDDVYDGTYDPNWTYTLTADEVKSFNSGVWTEGQLLNAKNQNTIPDFGKTEVMVEAPNVVGRNITLRTNKGVGSVADPVIITAEDIKNGLNSDQMSYIIRAEKGDLEASNGGFIIQLKNDVDVEATGNLTVAAKEHVYLGSEKDLKIDRIVSENGDIRLKTAANILNGRTDDGVNLIGTNLILETSGGSAGSADRRLVTDLRRSGVLTARVLNDLYLEERSGDLVSDSITSQEGLVDLLITDGNAQIGDVSAPKGVTIETKNGSVDFDTIRGSTLNFNIGKKGGHLSINKVLISNGMTVYADHINLPNVIQTVSDRPLHFNMSGWHGGMAESVSISAHSDNRVVFDRLNADFAWIEARSILQLLNANIGTRAEFTNNLYNVIVDNVSKDLFGSSVQLYTKGSPFYFIFNADRQFYTNAWVVDYSDYFLVNDFSTENSVVRMGPKLLSVTGYPGEAVRKQNDLNQYGTIPSERNIVDGAGNIRYTSDPVRIEEENAIRNESEVEVVRE